MIDTSKIIHAPVGGGRYTVTAPIVKEDYGLYLKIEGLELPSTYEVDFSNSEHSGTSVTMIGNSDGVLIPSQFIKSGKDVFAFLYHVGVDFGRTVYKFRIPNKLRPDRTNEEPTPEQASTIDQTIAALNTAVAKTAQDVISADQSAQSAKEDADRAEQAKTNAETAQGKAEDAQESAERAKDDAETSERNASESERKAKEYADTASEKADAITGLTTQATTLPDGSSATVSYNAETGVMSFGIPKGADGTNGKDGKDGTDGDDGYSPAASVTKSGKVATITITDKNGTTSAQLSDGEDGATGATPNLTIGTVETLEPTESATASITGTPENPVLNLGIPQGEQGEVTAEEFLKAFVTDSASGSIASFPDGADDIPLKSLVVNIDPVQDLSQGDPSPTNICPISGWTGANVSATGENLLGGIDFANAVKASMPSASLDTTAKTVTFTGITDGNPNKIISGGVKFKENTQYTFINIGTTGNIKNVRWVYTDGTNDTSSASKTGAYTSASGKTVQALVKIDNSANAVVLYYEDCGIFEGILTVDDFKPYQGITIPISWQTEAGTVYGGKLDVLSGVLTVTHTYQEITKAVAKSENENGYFYYATAGYLEIPSIASLNAGLIADRFKVINNTNQNSLEGEMTFFANNMIRWKEQNGIAVENYNQWLAENPFHVCYKLSTPQTYQLTPHEIRSLLGTNNIFADTGDTHAEYRADPTLYISRLTEPDADMIADSNITSGQYFMVGNNLYKATANIANGGQIVVGTNCTSVSLAQALNEINA